MFSEVSCVCQRWIRLYCPLWFSDHLPFAVEKNFCTICYGAHFLAFKVNFQYISMMWGFVHLVGSCHDSWHLMTTRNVKIFHRWTSPEEKKLNLENEELEKRLVPRQWQHRRKTSRTAHSLTKILWLQLPMMMLVSSCSCLVNYCLKLRRMNISERPRIRAAV